VSGPKHSCGVLGLALHEDAVQSAYKALRIIQHRGQENAGLSVFDGETINTVKGVGLVHEVLTDASMSHLFGNTVIGHVRYSTVGSKSDINSQPIEVETKHGDIALAHNGDITNADELREKYLAKGWAFLTDSDSEIIIRILAKQINIHNDPVKAIRNTTAEIDGAYSLTILIGDKIYGVRDPYGFRPLCLGMLENGYIIASESAAIDVLRGDFISDVQPGDVVEMTASGFRIYPAVSRESHAHCMFEWVYFARPDSIMDGRESYHVRRNIGKILARECPAKADVVIPVPDSGRAHGIGYAEASGIPYEEGLMKNRHVERTFIMPDQKKREAGVMQKLNPIRSTIEGKRLVVVDDSIVRGTTLRKLVQMLRRAGAEEVHVRIGCPPIIAPCYYGVDMKSRDQFVATNRSVEEIADLITADSLGYISMEGLVEALEMPESDLCLACVNGKYPTNIHGETHRFQSRLSDEF
jgi:amidophosphoribosyltransferase